MSERRPRGEERYPPLPDETQGAPSGRPAPRRRANRSIDPNQAAKGRTYNVVAAFFFAATVLALAVILFLWNNYNSPLNPLAPPTPLPIVVTATYTPTFTMTPEPTQPPSQTPTPSVAPTLTPSLTFTPILLEGFITPQGTLAPGITPGAAGSGDFPYTLRGAVVYRTNPDARGGCRWSSIGGTVLSYEGSPVNGFVVRIVGDGVDETVTTGSAAGFGPGGFELQLGSDSRDATYAAQLFDAQSVPVSAVYTVTTRADCAFNIAALPFVEVAPSP